MSDDKKVDDAAVEKIAGQAKQIDDMISSALLLVNDGDRVPFFLTAYTGFAMNTDSTNELTFNVPSDADFFGVRLNLYLLARLASTDTRNYPELTELVFRPVDWTCSSDIRGVFSNTTQPIAWSAANVQFELRNNFDANSESAYQSLPLTIAAAFSARQGLPDYSLVSVYGAGLDFPVDEWIRRGSTATVKVKTTFSPSSLPTPPQYYSTMYDKRTLEYRIFGVFTGYKLSLIHI